MHCAPQKATSIHAGTQIFVPVWQRLELRFYGGPGAGARLGLSSTSRLWADFRRSRLRKSPNNLCQCKSTMACRSPARSVAACMMNGPPVYKGPVRLPLHSRNRYLSVSSSAFMAACCPVREAIVPGAHEAGRARWTQQHGVRLRCTIVCGKVQSTPKRSLAFGTPSERA